MSGTDAGTVLIVDDNPRNLGLLSDTLSTSGFEVAVAVNGLRAIQLAKDGSPDLILLDVRMEGVDGYETCRRLKADPVTSEIPVIFMTASTDLSSDRVKGLNLGAVDFLAKPFLDEELLARVRVHTKLKRVMNRLEAQVKERMTAEAALQKSTQELQKLTQGLEKRVADRTVELEKTLGRLTQAQAHMATVIRAAQAVTGEVVLDKMLDRLLRITLEHAGARKCILVLARDSGLVIEASITKDPDTVQLGLSIPIERSADLAVRVVEEVIGTKESMFIWDTSREPRLAGDAYVKGSPPKSILGLAMMFQGEITGVLYVESGAVNQPFMPAQLETLGLLASQAAVALKNALLYDALRTSNDQLGTAVANQTEELRRTNERLTLEIAERERAEASRAAVQEEVIRAQNARLAELSTPLIPITDKIMVMPLIGTIDAGRAEQALDAALNGVQANRANVVIIDVTGVTVIDSAVASTLMSTAAALRLLGAKAVITGIRPELAQTLVALGIDLSAVVTKGTLKSGIDYALRRAGSESIIFRAKEEPAELAGQVPPPPEGESSKPV